MSSERRERARLGARLLAAPPPARRYPEQPLRRLHPAAARSLLAALALALAWSAMPAADPPGAPALSEPAADASTGDLALYDRIARRVAAGEDYYLAALAEQRAGDYPVRPFVTVRLPTLAWADARLGRAITGLGVVLLLLANMAAWHRALAERAGAPERIAAVVLAFLAGFATFEPRAALLHELVAGQLLSLSLAVYRPGLTWPALLALAAALAVRELALPFALLWLGLALFERRWKQASTLATILALFAAGLALHAFTIEQLLLPGDRASQGWGALAGPRLVLDGIMRFTPLVLLPAWLAGPLALLPLLGWLGLGGRLGFLAALWFAGFALAMALLAREANFYWALMLLPAYAIGLAFVPRAVRDCIRAALGRGQS